MTFQILFDPEKYRGAYRIRDIANGTFVTGPHSGATGPVTVELSEGHFSVHISHGAEFPFQVDDKGGSHSTSPGLHCRGATVSFNTARITIKPCHYRGTYAIAGIDDKQAAGARSFVTIAGLVSLDKEAGYILYFAPSCAIRFNVDAAGKPHVNDNYRSAATGKGKALLLNACDIEIVPSDLAIEWKVTGVEPGAAKGARSVTLVPAVPSDHILSGYILEVAPGAVGRFGVDNAGAPAPSQVVITQGTSTWRFQLAQAAP